MSTKIVETASDLSTASVDNIYQPYIRTAYDGSHNAASDRSALHFDPKIEPSLTKQSFVAECDINTILNNFAKTGLLSHVNERAPQYGDFTVLPEDYQTAINLVMDAQYQFDQLPALIRDRFHNDPQEMLAFLNDPNNYDEAIKLGLVNPPPAPEIDVDAPVSPPAGGDPQRPQTAGGGSSPASP